jgi:hypothetical protein
LYKITFGQNNTIKQELIKIKAIIEEFVTNGAEKYKITIIKWLNAKIVWMKD